MKSKMSAKTFLRSAKREQVMKIVLMICETRSDSAYDVEPIDMKEIYYGPIKNLPKEYENYKIWFWGIRDNTLLVMLT